MKKAEIIPKIADKLLYQSPRSHHHKAQDARDRIGKASMTIRSGDLLGEYNASLVTHRLVRTLLIGIVCASEASTQEEATPTCNNPLQRKANLPLLAVHPRTLPASPDNPWHFLKAPCAIPVSGSSIRSMGERLRWPWLATWLTNTHHASPGEIPPFTQYSCRRNLCNTRQSLSQSNDEHRS